MNNNDSKSKIKLYLHGEFDTSLTAQEHDKLLADLKPLTDKYEIYVSVETKI